jgi:hypothetical protein
LRENNYNTGLRGVLFDAEHYARMGPAVWLYGWLILRQTHQTGTIGWVLGGAPIHYREIEGETGFNRRTLERWMQMLRRQKYIETEVVESGIRIRILKAKKHLQRNVEANGVRGNAGGVRRVAGTVTRNCVASGGERYMGQRSTAGIGSSSVVRIKEKAESEMCGAVEREEKTEQNKNLQDSWSDQKLNQNQPNQDQQNQTRELQIRPLDHRPSHRENERPSVQQNFSWDLRERMRMIRAERDDAVRRELQVGSGPEV